MTFRVLTAELAHETNTFSRLLTGKQAFRNRYVLIGDDAIAARRNANTELAGFIDASHLYGWHLEHVLSAAAGPSGKVKRAAFEWLCDPIVAAVERGRATFQCECTVGDKVVLDGVAQVIVPSRNA